MRELKEALDEWERGERDAGGKFPRRGGEIGVDGFELRGENLTEDEFELGTVVIE